MHGKFNWIIIKYAKCAQLSNMIVTELWCLILLDARIQKYRGYKHAKT